MDCIFYTEFDPSTGPKVVHQLPPDYSNIDIFSNFFIPKSYFCNRLLCVEIDNYLLISHPVYIEDVKYERNLFAFNVGAILNLKDDIEAEDDIVVYKVERSIKKPKVDIQSKIKHAIRKLAIKMKEFEIQNHFLTCDENRINIKYLLNVLKAKILVSDQINVLFEDLNYFSVHLNMPKLIKMPIDQIHDFAVPMPLIALEEMEITCPNIKRLTLEINGVDSIVRLAAKLDIAIELVKLIIQQLLYFSLVDLVDIFQYRNSYALTAEFIQFCDDERQKELSSKFVSKVVTSILDVTLYYSQIIPGESVSDFIQRTDFPTELLDIRRFFVNGMLRKIIRRIREYPILRRDGKLRHYHSASLVSQPENGRMNEILPLVRSNKDMDELCLLLNMSPTELEKIFQQQFSEEDQFLVTLNK